MRVYLSSAEAEFNLYSVARNVVMTQMSVYYIIPPVVSRPALEVLG